MREKFTYTSKYATYNECEFVVAHYTNGNKALTIWDTMDGGMITYCTVNGVRINANDEIGIKNYSENEGMVDFLIAMDIIEKNPVDIEHSGFVKIPYHKLTQKGMKLFE